MKKIVSFLAFCCIFSTATAQLDYQPKFETMKGQDIICPAGLEDANTYVPPPKFIQDALKNRARMIAKSTFIVNYKGFPPAAQKAFQDAVDIWSGLISSPVVIRIDANWEKLDDGVLGAASPADFVRNFDGAQKAFTWHPIALAEKLARKEINGTEPDITARFSSTVNWYLGSAGAPATGQYDFTSTVLHEIGHGLGFTGSMRVATNSGSWGYGTGSPFIFDQYIENVAGLLLVSTDNFKNPSTQLADEIKSDNLFFNSPIATQRNGGVKPKLFAPNVYSGGSSVYHLNSETYPSGNINSLMTPSTNQREVIKDPGPLTLNMFAEMGWKGTAVLHERLKDTENLTSPIAFRTRIESDTTLIASSAKLVYSINDSLNTKKITVDLTKEANSNFYTYSLPATPENKTIRYYFEVKDNSGRTFTNPPQAPKYTWSFKVAVDKEAPVLTHFPVDLAYEKDSVFILAQVTDNLGVDTVYTEYSVNGAAKTSTLGMKKIRNDIYEVLLPLTEIKGGNKIRYRVIAKDKAKAKNQTISPAKDFYEFAVVKLNAVQNRYVNNFNTPSTDFAGNSFSITQPSGFDNPAIHSEHPYKNGSDPNSESNYIYQLLTPIKIRADTPTIRFDEIVLVEPGDAGSKFGDDAFYDYVVVEGSTDGSNWIEFADGYDSRAEKTWLTAYDSSPVKDTEFSTATQNVFNSGAKGTKDLFITREINMLKSGDFKAGDVVLIRFRLFADQLTYGWGWAIDNLKIQVSPPPVITSVEPKEEIDLTLSPNPSPDELLIKSKLTKPGKVLIEVVNMQGAKVITKEYDSPTSVFYEKINTKNLANGTYILKIFTEDNQKWRRFVVVH
jgi:Secretion system C-terminal sorting domain